MNKTDLTPKKYCIRASNPINTTHLLKCEKEDYYKIFFAIRIPELQHSYIIGIMYGSILEQIWEEARNYKINKNDFYQAHQIDYILTTEMNERINARFYRIESNPFFDIYGEILNSQVDTNYYLTKTTAKRNIENELQGIIYNH